jgi:hypothetical protein
MSTNNADTHSNPAVTSEPGAMHGPERSQQDGIAVCNVDDQLREKALRESSLRVPR